jgi:hypothetical protein
MNECGKCVRRGDNDRDCAGTCTGLFQTVTVNGTQQCVRSGANATAYSSRNATSAICNGTINS